MEINITESKEFGLSILDRLFREPSGVIPLILSKVDNAEYLGNLMRLGYPLREVVTHSPKLQSPEFRDFTEVLINSVEQPQKSIQIWIEWLRGSKKSPLGEGLH